MTPPTLSDQIFDGWYHFAASLHGEHLDLIHQTEIEHDRHAGLLAGEDHLVRRLLVPAADALLFRMVGLLADDRARTGRLVADPTSMFAEVARLSVPDSSRREIYESFLAKYGLEVLLDPAAFAQWLVCVEWDESLRRRMDRSHPALPVDIVRPLAKLLSGRCTFPETNPGAWSIRHRGEDFGTIQSDVSVGRPRRNRYAGNLVPAEFEAACGSRYAHQILRELVTRGWESMLHRQSDPAHINIVGGFAALATELGIHGGSGRAALYRATHVLGLVHLRPDGGTPAGLLTILGGSRDAEATRVEVRLQNQLVPGYIMRKRKGDNRVLVPLPAVLPPVVSSKLMARAYSYQMLLLLEMRKKAVEFDADRYLHIPRAQRQAYARDVGLSDENRRAIEDGWLASGPNQFLEEGARDHFRLGRAYTTTDLFLAHAKELSLNGRRRARRAQRLGERGRPGK